MRMSAVMPVHVYTEPLTSATQRSHTASPLVGHYQIILLGNGCTSVLVSERLAQGCYVKVE